MEEIYTDGSAHNVNGDGAAAVYYPDRREYDWFGPVSGTSSDRMEIMGLIMVVEELKKERPHPVTIYCDNQYVVKTINEWWWKWGLTSGRRKRKANYDLWTRFFKSYHGWWKKEISVVWVKGHSGVEGNEKVDRMASKTRLRQGKKPIKDKKNGFKSYRVL